MINIIFDTDPGVDDAFALLYALNHPNINVLGITTVFGNVPVETSTKNALILYHLDNYRDVGNECGIPFDDKYLKIKWHTNKPILSKRDKLHEDFLSFKKKIISL